MHRILKQDEANEHERDSRQAQLCGGGMKHGWNASGTTWRDLYAQALFEADRGKVGVRIARAESEIVSRARELFSTDGQHSDERKALDRALHMLQVLKTCHQTGATEHLVA